jgi:hypothetical protein
MVVYGACSPRLLIFVTPTRSRPVCELDGIGGFDPGLKVYPGP